MHRFRSIIANIESAEDWEALYDSDVATATASDRNHLVPLPCFYLHFDSCLVFLHEPAALGFPGLVWLGLSTKLLGL